MGMLYRLEDAILGPIARLFDGAVMATLARLVFLGTLAVFFFRSGMTKLGDGIAGIFSPSVGAYAQILPKQMEAVGYDPSQLGTFSKLIVLFGTWGEFIIPALVIIGLFTRAASLAMIAFIVVMSVVDVTGHGADAATLGAWFDGDPYSNIIDSRSFWIFLLLVIFVRGAGPISLDAILKRPRPVHDLD